MLKGKWICNNQMVHFQGLNTANKEEGKNKIKNKIALTWFSIQYAPNIFLAPWAKHTNPQ